MMNSLITYIPSDRRQAMIRNEILPDQMHGAVLFADISGFSSLTDALVQEFGSRRGADELTKHLNRIYETLINEVHRYGGSIINFSGDAITCWFNQNPSTDPEQVSLQATTCALVMQQTMERLAAIEIPSGATVSLAIKIAVTTGPTRRFLVGDPYIQYIDVLAGATVDQMAEIEKQAQKGEVVVGPEVISYLGEQVKVTEWRHYKLQARVGPEVETNRSCAVVAGLTETYLEQAETYVPPAVFTSTEQDLSERQIRPWLLPPVYERLKAGRGQFLAELRAVVALFLSFQGLDYDRDEAAGEKLDAYIRWVQNTLALYEGYLIQLTTGDKGNYFYAAFGAPLAHDDDASRAVAAALQLRSPLPGLDFITDIKIGLSQGRMRTGAYGSSARCTYGVLGDEVNTAAWLMQGAEPGQILISQRVADRVRKSHRFKYLGLIKVKGKPNPLPIFAVLGQRLSAGRSSLSPSVSEEEREGEPQVERYLGETPLVGREAELSQINQILAFTMTGKGQILRLEGEAGMGKSRLTSELAEQARRQGFKVSMAACQSISQGTPYYPWRQIFRTLFELSDEPFEGADLAAWTSQQIARLEAIINAANSGWLLRLPLLGDLLGLPIPDNPTTIAFDPRLRREALLALAVEIIQAQAQPCLLLIEDIHWIDEASLALTLALARVIAAAPILLSLVHRPSDRPLLHELNQLPYYYHLPLAELSSVNMTMLIANRLPGRVSALALTFIQTQAQGNPFFAEELMKALCQTNELYRSAGGIWDLSETMFKGLQQANCLIKDRQGEWTLGPQALLSAVELGLPDTIHGLVLSRLDSLPGAHKLTLKVASVIGPAFEFEVLAEAHPLHPRQADLLEQLDIIQKYDFIRQTTPLQLTYVFKHHIIQEVAYDHLPGDQQRELHQLVGETLERLRPEAVEPLVYHYSRSGVRDKTLFYLDQAARKTQREYANETALNYYNQALALEERWEWRRSQVEVLHLLGRREEEHASLELLEAMLSQAEEGQKSAGEIVSASGHISSLELPLHSPAVFEAADLWGQYYEVIGHYTQAQAAVERALAASRELDHLASEIRCLAQLGLVAFRQGNYENAKEWYNQALALYHPEEMYPFEVTYVFIRSFYGLGTVHQEQGEYHQSQGCYKEALRLSRLSGDRPGEAKTLFGLGATAFYQRRFAEAQNYFQQALEIQQAIGDRSGEGTTLHNLAEVLTDAGDYGQAPKYLTAGLTILQATGNRWQQIYVWNSLGIIYLTLGDFLTGQGYLEQGLQLAQEIGADESRAYILVNLGLVMQFQGDLARAERVLTEGLALAQAMHNKRLVAAFLSYLSTVSLDMGRHGLAIKQAQAALELRNELKLRLQTTYDLTTLVAVYLALDNRVEALAYADQVLAILEECKGEGPEFPERDFLISYQALAAAGQKEQATVVLKAAYGLVMSRADKITDLSLRQSFLKQVAVNREIVMIYEQQIQATDS